MSQLGADIGRVYPRTSPDVAGSLLRVSGGGQVPINLGTSGDIENGLIRVVSPMNAFKPGQQVYFNLTIYNANLTGEPPFPAIPSWISSVRLKPWFARQADEFRAPGFPTWTGNDQLNFGGGTVTNNRQVWAPVQKMIDISEWQAVNPPPAAPPRHSDSIMVDDIWKFDLQDPNSVPYQNTLLPGPPRQTRLGRLASFRYVAHGWALGFTQEFVVSGTPNPGLNLFIDITWQATSP